MDTVTPRIVIENDTPSPPPTAAPGRAPAGPSHAPPRVEGEGNSAFAKIVRTVQLIKKWAGRTEETADQREAFLTRFKPAGPNIDDAYIYSSVGGEGECPGGEKGTPTKLHWLNKLAFLDPMGNVVYRWLFVITLAILYNSFAIIARQTFSQLQDTGWKLGLWLTFDYIADTIYVLDMVVHFRTGGGPVPCMYS